MRESTAVELRASLVETIRREPEPSAITRSAVDLHLLLADDLQALVPHRASQDAIARSLREAVARGTSILIASGMAPAALPAFTDALEREPWYRHIPCLPCRRRSRGRWSKPSRLNAVFRSRLRLLD